VPTFTYLRSRILEYWADRPRGRRLRSSIEADIANEVDAENGDRATQALWKRDQPINSGPAFYDPTILNRSSYPYPSMDESAFKQTK
jgi:hypothetical protein